MGLRRVAITAGPAVLNSLRVIALLVGNRFPMNFQVLRSLPHGLFSIPIVTSLCNGRSLFVFSGRNPTHSRPDAIYAAPIFFHSRIFPLPHAVSGSKQIIIATSTRRGTRRHFSVFSPSHTGARPFCFFPSKYGMTR